MNEANEACISKKSSEQNIVAIMPRVKQITQQNELNVKYMLLVKHHILRRLKMFNSKRKKCSFHKYLKKMC